MIDLDPAATFTAARGRTAVFVLLTCARCSCELPTGEHSRMRALVLLRDRLKATCFPSQRDSVSWAISTSSHSAFALTELGPSIRRTIRALNVSVYSIVWSSYLRPLVRSSESAVSRPQLRAATTPSQGERSCYCPETGTGGDSAVYTT